MAVSELPMPAGHGAQLWPLSIQAYRTLGELGLIPENTELLYGQVFQKMAKSPLHSALVRCLLRLLQSRLPVGCFLSSEQPVTCADSEPEPDVAVIRGAEEDFWQEHPTTAELIIEVCITSHEYDRSKLRAYANASVKEVWLVLAPEKQIEVHRAPAGDQFTQSSVHGPGGELTCAALPELAISLDSLFGKS